MIPCPQTPSGTHLMPTTPLPIPALRTKVRARLAPIAPGLSASAIAVKSTPPPARDRRRRRRIRNSRLLARVNQIEETDQISH